MAISDELRKQVDPNNESCCEHCLSSKCKEWALSNGHYLKSRGVNILCKELMPKCEVEYIGKNNMFVTKDFYSNTENGY